MTSTVDSSGVQLTQPVAPVELHLAFLVSQVRVIGASDVASRGSGWAMSSGERSC